MFDSIEVPVSPSHAPNLELGPLEEFGSLEIADQEALVARLFTGYAAPLSWGPWVQVAAHGGVVSYTISYQAIGNTLVHGAVNYYSSSGWRTDVFRDSTTIRTGNAWAAVKVCFHGNPLGSAVRGQINP